MIKTGDKIGYIKRWKGQGDRETFRFVEGTVKSVRVGKRKTSVYTDKFYSLDAEEVESNTRILASREGLMLVGEPFLTTDEYSAHCREVVDYWNEHGAESCLKGAKSA